MHRYFSTAELPVTLLRANDRATSKAVWRWRDRVERQYAVRAQTNPSAHVDRHPFVTPTCSPAHIHEHHHTRRQLSADPYYFNEAGVPPPSPPELHLFKKCPRKEIGTAALIVVWLLCMRDDEVAVVLADEHTSQCHAGKNNMCFRLRTSYFLP